MPRTDLAAFVSDNLQFLAEEEALAALENPYVTPAICAQIARNQRLAGFYSVRLKLVTHRQTPQAHATRLIHYIYWPDLLRLSVDMKVSPVIRRAIETQLVNRVGELSLGERISSARRCSPALIKTFLFDPDPKVFAALLVNSRLREDELVYFASSPKAAPEQLNLLAADTKWSYRYAIRKALAMNPSTPRSTAASQLRYLSLRDLRMIHGRAETSVYLKKCIERMEGEGRRRAGA